MNSGDSDNNVIDARFSIDVNEYTGYERIILISALKALDLDSNNLSLFDMRRLIVWVEDYNGDDNAEDNSL